MKPKCLLDMDGVIANWHLAFHRHIGLGTAGTLPYTVNWDGVDQAFWENIEPTPEANDIVELVINQFGIDRIAVCTLYPVKHGYPWERIHECYLGKVNWLKKHFPELITHFCLTPSKWFTASPWSLLVDDSDDNIDEFVEEGGNGLLVPRPWNSLSPNSGSSSEVMAVVKESLSDWAIYFRDTPWRF